MVCREMVAAMPQTSLLHDGQATNCRTCALLATPTCPIGAARRRRRAAALMKVSSAAGDVAAYTRIRMPSLNPAIGLLSVGPGSAQCQN